MLITTQNTLWAMHPNHLANLAISCRRLRQPTARQLDRAFNAQAKALRQVSGKVAVLPAYGCVQQRTSPWAYYYGGVSTELLGNALESLLARQEVAAVVIDFDSPGGTCGGVAELSDLIFGLRGDKPIVAVANSMAASAAYWIATACDQLAVTPGGEVGSVGVYMAHADYSAALAEQGVKITIIKTGKYKAEGNPYEPLSADAQESFQTECDAVYTQFVKAVARNRGTTASDVTANFGQGRCMMAAPALAAKMSDRTATLRQVLAKLMGTGPAAKSVANAASAEVLRLRHSRRKQLAELAALRAS